MTTTTGDDEPLIVDVMVEPAESVVVNTTSFVVVVNVDPAELVVVRTKIAAAATDPLSVVVYVDPAEFVVVSTDPLAVDGGGIVLVNVLPAESVTVVTRAAPDMPALAAPRRALMADSRDIRLDW